MPGVLTRKHYAAFMLFVILKLGPKAIGKKIFRSRKVGSHPATLSVTNVTLRSGRKIVQPKKESRV